MNSTKEMFKHTIIKHITLCTSGGAGIGVSSSGKTDSLVMEVVVTIGELLLTVDSLVVVVVATGDTLWALDSLLLVGIFWWRWAH